MKQCRLDTYVVDTLMADLVLHERSASAFLVYVYLARSSGSSRSGVRLSHQAIAIATGLSKSAVQSAVRVLLRRRLLRSQRDSITAVPRSYALMTRPLPIPTSRR